MARHRALHRRDAEFVAAALCALTPPLHTLVLLLLLLLILIRAFALLSRSSNFVSEAHLTDDDYEDHTRIDSSKLKTSSGITMGGPPKKHVVREKPYGNSAKSSSSGDATERSSLQSIPRLDGNRDPTVAAVDYSQPNDLKNISEFLGLAGWYKARGVSFLTFLRL